MLELTCFWRFERFCMSYGDTEPRGFLLRRLKVTLLRFPGGGEGPGLPLSS